MQHGPDSFLTVQVLEASRGFMTIYVNHVAGCIRSFLVRFVVLAMTIWERFMHYTVEEMQVRCGVMLWRRKRCQLRVTVQSLQHSLLAMRH